MKIEFKLVAFLVFISFSALAQSDKRFRIGPHVGIGMAQISKLASGEKAVFRPNFGISMDIRTGPHVTFNTGLTHVTLGESQNLSSYPSASKYVDLYQTLMIPLGLKIHPKSNRFFGMIGAQPGFIYKNDFKSDNISSYQSYYKKVDFGAIAGVGYNLGNSLCLDLRYYHGITNIHKSNSMTLPIYGRIDIQKESYRMFNLTACYYF
ncbi:hypothetical protein DSL64_14275 [Dyadobacter luteus]|uniref:Outer membrane protein beta-barrel domain-containing protein n=1 Tax=Dyadobacter luteus TaxID=2259619 RepID=A0A3D8YBC0_9BACT|nr:porin family protein [Dyadobacter luteus]REA60698.1 hypothetical protein DSL64_14275 [Dyadobacter luteus]